MSNNASPSQPQPKIGPNDVLRFFLELFAFVTLGIWGFVAFPLPWPGVLVGLGEVDGGVEHRSARVVAGDRLDSGRELGTCGRDCRVVLLGCPGEPPEVLVPDDEPRLSHVRTLPIARRHSVGRSAARRPVHGQRPAAHGIRPEVGASEDDGAAPREEDAGLGVVAHRTGQHAPLDVTPDGDEPFGRLGMGDADDVLFDDRPLVEVGRDVMR